MSNLIVIKNKEVLSLPFLRAAILKFVFEEENMSVSEVDRMKRSMCNWYEHLQYCKETGKEHEDMEYRLMLFGKFLKDNEEGKFDAQKQMYRAHGIDYKKRFGLVLPTEKEKFIAQGHLERAKKANPDEYA